MNRMLRRLPERPAPAGFEARVMAEIARRAALPWWRRSYATWPLAARVLFFIGSAFAAAVLVVGVSRVAPSVSNWSSSWSSAFAVFRLVGGSLFSRIPVSVLYGIGGTIVLGYAMLVGVGSALYRNLTSPSSP